MPLVPAAEVERVALAALQAAGAPDAAARVQITLLLEAELRGLPSHGLLRLLHIVQRIGNGVIDPRATGRHDWRAPSFLAVDGEQGLGPVVALRALEAAIARAEETGVALAAVANSNHLGMLAWYAEYASARGAVLLAFTTSEALVHPWGGRRALIGTNPIAIGVPTAAGPFVMDTATSLVSMGKIHDHAHRGLPLEPGWALDAEGNPTTDATAAKSGAIAPFGGAKGYALGLAFELLVASVTNSAVGTDVRGTLDATEVCNKGDLFIVIRPGASDQASRLAQFLDVVRATPAAESFDVVRVPGDRATHVREERLRTGLPVADEVWTRIQALADAADVTP